MRGAGTSPIVPSVRRIGPFLGSAEGASSRRSRIADGLSVFLVLPEGFRSMRSNLTSTQFADERTAQTYKHSPRFACETSRSAFSKSRTVQMSAALIAPLRASPFNGNVTSDASGRFLRVLMVRHAFGLVPRVNSRPCSRSTGDERALLHRAVDALTGLGVEIISRRLHCRPWLSSLIVLQQPIGTSAIGSLPRNLWPPRRNYASTTEPFARMAVSRSRR